MTLHAIRRKISFEGPTLISWLKEFLISIGHFATVGLFLVHTFCENYLPVSIC